MCRIVGKVLKVYVILCSHAMTSRVRIDDPVSGEPQGVRRGVTPKVTFPEGHKIPLGHHVVRFASFALGNKDIALPPWFVDA
jgi:hypothetical protein